MEDSEKKLKLLVEDFSNTHPGVHVIVVLGHNHNYERYLVKGITYIVTGGGATPYRISRHRADFYNDSGPTYHYCKFSIAGNVLTGEMYKLTLGDAGGAPAC